jgi:hypothetical protein
MPTKYSVNHIQILRLAYFAELRYLLTFSGGRTDASLPLYGKGLESMGVEEVSGTTGYLDDATDFSYMWAAKATTRRVRAQNRSQVSRKEWYLHQSRKKGDT